MKKWVRLAARFYPSSWRHRYGAEFDAIQSVLIVVRVPKPREPALETDDDCR